MKYYVVNNQTGDYGVYPTREEAQLNVDGPEWVLLEPGERIEQKSIDANPLSERIRS